MEVYDKYVDLVDWINVCIEQFNRFLSEEASLSHVSVQDPATFSSDFDLEWNSQHWPSKDDYGVYFLYGTDGDSQGVYVGKASQKYIGFRVYSHLNRINRDRVPGEYIWSAHGHNYNISAMIAVPFKVPSLATAFEEFVIGQGHNRIALINKVGVRNSNFVDSACKSWSDSAQQATLDIFESQNFMSEDNNVWLKNINGTHGYIEQADAFKDIFKITILDDRSTKTYSTVEEMLKDGWVID